MKKLITLIMLCASSVLAQNPVFFKQGSLMTITNSTASTNGIQLQAELVDSQQPNKTSKITLMREQVSVSPYRLVGTPFYGIKDTNFWTETVGVGGSVLATNGITINVTTAATASVEYRSVRRARYISGSANNFRAQVRLCGSSNTNTLREWGIENTPIDDNGVFFQYIGTNLLLTMIYNGVETSITNGNFNVSQWTATTNINSYEIQYNNGTVEFFCQDLLLHKHTASVKPWSATMELGICFEAKNLAAVTNADFVGCMEIRVASISRYGAESSTPIWRNISGATSNTYKYSAGFLHSIVVGTAGTLCTVYDGYGSTFQKMIAVDINKTTGGIGTYTIDTPFFTGLTVVTTGAGTDIMLVYE